MNGIYRHVHWESPSERQRQLGVIRDLKTADTIPAGPLDEWLDERCELCGVKEGIWADAHGVLKCSGCHFEDLVKPAVTR